MKYRAVSMPGPSRGVATGGKKLTVPDQSMSLKTILERFVRHEALPVGLGGVYHESDDDLEKVAAMDLTEKDEFIARQKETQKRYEEQEKQKERKRLETVRAEEREKVKAELKAEAEKTANKAP